MILVSPANCFSRSGLSPKKKNVTGPGDMEGP